MKSIIVVLSFIVIFVVLFVNGWDMIEENSDTIKTLDWGLIVQFLIFGALPGLLTILGILWLVGFLFKISRKLDD